MYLLSPVPMVPSKLLPSPVAGTTPRLVVLELVPACITATLSAIHFDPLTDIPHEFGQMCNAYALSLDPLVPPVAMLILPMDNDLMVPGIDMATAPSSGSETP